MTDSLVLRRCATLSEAHICVGLLNSRGIWAVLDNEYYAAIDWGSVPAIGGVHVRVRAADYEVAKDIIISCIEDAPERLTKLEPDMAPIPNPRRWRAVTMLLVWFGVAELAGVLLVLTLHIVIPHEWIPAPDPEGYWFSLSVGSGVAAPGPRIDGLVLILMIGLFLFWELLSTQPERPKKEPLV